MRNLVIPLLAAASLCGCVGGPTTQASAAGGTASYNCVSTEDAPAGIAHPYDVVGISRSHDSKAVVLQFGAGEPQILNPVEGDSEHLFANSSFAWRVGEPSSVLTDVESVQTYTCQRIAAAQTATPDTAFLRSGHRSTQNHSRSTH